MALQHRAGPARAIAAAALLVAFCRDAERPLPVIHDLARLAPAADFEGGLEYIAFGTPLAAGAGVVGVVTPREPEAERFAWLRPRAELRVRSAPGEARRLLLDLEPHPSAGPLPLSVLWNGRRSGRVAELARERRLYMFDVPPSRVAPDGTNRLSLRLGGADRQVAVPRGRLAARLYGLWLGAPGEPALDPDSVDASQPPVLARAGATPEVVLAPGRLRFALRLPERAELRFAARLVRGERATLRVTLDSGAGAEQELWHGAPSGREATVSLHAPADLPVRLSLHVEAASNAVRVAWSLPRVLGAARPPFPSAHSESDEALADPLRADLGGANVVLVVLDAAAARSFGALGGPKEATPEFDRLAKEGVVFENAFTPAVYTFPAIYSLFTSLSPDEHGNLDPWAAHLSRPPLVLAEAAAARNIHTAAFVASPMVGPSRDFDRGFAEFHKIYTSHDDPTEAESFRPHLERFLAASTDRRFLAWAHFREPHFPYDPKPPFDRIFGEGPIPKELRSDPKLLSAIEEQRWRALPAEIDHLRRLYLGSLAYVDREVGWLRRRLEASGLLEKTVLIVTADHGEAFWEHSRIGHNVQVYDELARVPLLMRLPARTGTAGLRIRSLVELSDLAPTIADALGFWREGRPPFQGLSLLPIVAGAPGRPFVVTRDGAAAPRYALRDERSTCILNTFDDSVELYDRVRDATEARDLAKDEPLAADQCRQAVRAWVLDQRPRGEPAEAPPVSAEDRERLRALGYVQ